MLERALRRICTECGLSWQQWHVAAVLPRT